jgi:hypothetical protein
MIGGQSREQTENIIILSDPDDIPKSEIEPPVVKKVRVQTGSIEEPIELD